MSSPTAKVGKSHNTQTNRKRRTSGSKTRVAGTKKKATLKKIVRRATVKKAGARRDVKRPVGKKATARRKVAKRPPRQTTKKLRPARGSAATATPKRVYTPEATAAVRAFEHALKVFNRHDFSGAKLAFENILQRYADQTEVVAGVRTYMAVCDQRLARTPSPPRSAEGLYDRGVLEYNRGNARDAIDLFEKALKAEPRADHIMYSLAAAYARTGNVAKTLDYLRRAIVIRPVHRSHARRDPDFTNLHVNDDFQELVGLGLDFPD